MGFTQQITHEVTYMTAPNIETSHAFTTRHGGVSEGIFLALNLGLNRGDNPAKVRENYSRLCRALGILDTDIVIAKQVHGANVEIVTRKDCGQLYAPTQREADGLITQELGVALMVFTADCVPILLHDAERGVIGAVHAGWRGTVADVAGAAARKMASRFGCADIYAAIGPCISKCCFETGPDVAQAMHKTLGQEAESCIQPCGEKFMVDLKEANRVLLMRAGLRAENITVSDECTFCQSDKYWSHRRTNGERGSQAAIIVMRGKNL